MKKPKLILAPIALIIIGVVAYSNFKSSEHKTKSVVPLKVGVIGPFTGNAGAYGKWVRDGLDAARSDLRSPESVIILYEDDKGDPAVGNTAFKKLVTIDKAEVI